MVTKSIECGKCDSVAFKTEDDFAAHKVLTHSGLARPKGQIQNFTDKERDDELAFVFKEHRQVPCCGCQKKFRSARSLKDHWHKEAVCNPQKPVTGGGLNIVECGRCDVQFASMDSTAYRAHVAYCHSGPT